MPNMSSLSPLKTDSTVPEIPMKNNVYYSRRQNFFNKTSYKNTQINKMSTKYRKNRRSIYLLHCRVDVKQIKAGFVRNKNKNITWKHSQTQAAISARSSITFIYLLYDCHWSTDSQYFIFPAHQMFYSFQDGATLGLVLQTRSLCRSTY